MFLAGLGSIRVVKNCDRGLENAARGRSNGSLKKSLTEKLSDCKLNAMRMEQLDRRTEQLQELFVILFELDWMFLETMIYELYSVV